MLHKYTICAFFVLSVCMLQITNASPSDATNIIIDAIKNQIQKLISLIERMVSTALSDLAAVKRKVADLTQAAIKLATDAINSVIDSALDSVRKIAEDALDAGINITECYVRSVDDLNIIRRRLLADEILCATGEMKEFNGIINQAVKNFTDDLELIGALPHRLQECLTSLNAIQCVADLVRDVTKLQQDIPEQILGTMLQVTDYMTGFVKRVHQCQFDQLRLAIQQSRKVVDGVRSCARQTNATGDGLVY